MKIAWVKNPDGSYKTGKFRIHPMVAVSAKIFPDENKAYIYLHILVAKVTIKVKSGIFDKIENRILKLMEVFDENN